jgi:5'(3')-deoxyribonucleotidase
MDRLKINGKFFIDEIIYDDALLMIEPSAGYNVTTSCMHVNSRFLRRNDWKQTNQKSLTNTDCPVVTVYF